MLIANLLAQTIDEPELLPGQIITEGEAEITRADEQEVQIELAVVDQIVASLDQALLLGRTLKRPTRLSARSSLLLGDSLQEWQVAFDGIPGRRETAGRSGARALPRLTRSGCIATAHLSASNA